MAAHRGPGQQHLRCSGRSGRGFGHLNRVKGSRSGIEGRAAEPQVGIGWIAHRSGLHPSSISGLFTQFDHWLQSPSTTGTGARARKDRRKCFRSHRTWLAVMGGLAAGAIGVTAFAGATASAAPLQPLPPPTPGVHSAGAGAPERHGPARQHQQVHADRAGGLTRLPRRLPFGCLGTRRGGPDAGHGDPTGRRNNPRLPAVEGRQARSAEAPGIQCARHHPAGAHPLEVRCPTPMCPTRSR